MFDVRVSAGGREVNTTAMMATITVMMMMMKFLSSQTQVQFLEGEKEDKKEEEMSRRSKWVKRGGKEGEQL